MNALAVVVLLLSLAAYSLANKQKRSDLPQNNGVHDAVSGSFYAYNETARPNQKSANNESPVWWKRPEWWLFVLGVPTLGFVGWQAKTTASSAKATLRSVKLQEAALRQWVRIEHWRNSGDNLPLQITETLLQIGFSVHNPTKMPLTLTDLRIEVGKGRGTYQESVEFVIPPERDYETSIAVTLKGADFECYVDKGLAFGVQIDVGFTDALEYSRRQHVTYILNCSPGKCFPAEFSSKQS